MDRLMLERLVDELVDECEPLLQAWTSAADPAPGDDPGLDTATGASPWPPPSPDALGHPRAEADQTRAAPLTEHQARIVRLVGEGMSNAEIAGQLCVEVSTVKSHVSRVLQRLNLRDREQLIVHVWRSGAMDSPGGTAL